VPRAPIGARPPDGPGLAERRGVPAIARSTIAAVCAPGVTFSKQILLRAGIVLFGLRLTFQDIANVGLPRVVIDALILSSTFGLSWWAGTRLLGIDRRTAMLIGAGSSICGAAAIMATEPVVRGGADQVTVAMSTVVVFGTLAIFLYPALYEVKDKKPSLINFDFANGLYTVPKDVDAGYLAIGKQRVDFHRNTEAK